MKQSHWLNRLLILFAVLVMLIWVDAVYFEPNWLKLERVTIPVHGLPANYEGYTIVQLSDLHMSVVEITIKRVRNAVDMANQLHPDLIVLTGDFVRSDRLPKLQTLAQEISRLEAPDGVYASLGNHDWRGNISVVADALSQAHIPSMENEYVLLHRGSSRLYLAGLGDMWVGHQNLSLTLEGIPAGEFIILMAHEPDIADQVALDGRVSIQLSGHAHGGQVRIPGLPALVTTRFGRKYTDGLYTLGSMHLYVTRGVGVVTPLVRLFCRPEVTLITLIGE